MGMIWDMARVQTVSKRFELQDLLMSHKELSQNAVRLFSRAEMMFPSTVRQPGGLETVAQAVEQVHHQMQIAGIPSGASYQALAVALDRYDSIAGAPQSRWPELVGLLSATVSEMNDQIEASPVPGGEWKQVVELLGDEKTAKLLGVSLSSVRRYASSARPTPAGGGRTTAQSHPDSRRPRRELQRLRHPALVRPAAFPVGWPDAR